MPRPYTTTAGDTFDLIARKTLGDDTQAPRIAAANPGVSEPLAVGTVLSVPDAIDAPGDPVTGATDAGVDEVAVNIDGQRFRFWNDVTVTRSLDSFDAISLSAPFDAEAAGFRQLFVPFSYKPVSVLVGGSRLFTGTIVAVEPSLEAGRKTLQLAGYSLPGVLNDCNPPASSYPLEFNGQTLKQIAEALAAPFGITVKFEADPGARFKKTACGTSKKVFEYLAELARQRNLIAGSNEAGELVFRRSQSVDPVAGPPAPVARLRQGLSPLLSVAPRFNPQEYYSTVTGIEPPEAGSKGSQYTAKNPHAGGLVRPLTFTVDDAKGGTVKQAVEARLARMFASAVSYQVEVSTWRDSRGTLWAPDSLLTLEAPDAMVYSETTMLVRSVSFSRPAKRQTATLNLVLPGAFSGEVPGVLPWV